MSRDLNHYNTPDTEFRFFESMPWLVLLFVILGLSGCGSRIDDSPKLEIELAEQSTSQQAASEESFDIYWPPRDASRSANSGSPPLLDGKLSIFESDVSPSNSFRLNVTLTRPDSEAARLRWNQDLAFPEYSWMAKVRVWDRKREWIWPNLPFLLRAHGTERIERYGGIDPSKGLDNDFAAVLIRPLGLAEPGAGQTDSKDQTAQMVSAEWYPADSAGGNKRSIVHVARSDDFEFIVGPAAGHSQSGEFAVWLIYADFLEASFPHNWPQNQEYAGGILAYFEVNWTRTKDGKFAFETQSLVPPMDTGFDWQRWSTGTAALKKKLELERKID